MRFLPIAWGGAAWLLGCNVAPGGITGGVDQPATGDCPRGVVATQSDYQSSELALLSPEGQVKSVAFLSSASTATSGLAAPFSGDLVVAGSRTLSGEIVLVDRLGTNVVSFTDPKTANVRAQLPIGTGFESNPQDYVQVSEHKAYVPRLGENSAPGRQAFDSGSDLLVMDPSVPEIIGSVPLPVKQGFRPNPSSITLFQGEALVVLQHARADYSAMEESEIVAVSAADDSISYRLPLEGLQNCGRVEVSPSRELLAVACSAFVDRNGAVREPAASALVLLDATVAPPVERRRFAASEVFGGPIQASVEFVNESLLLVKSQTAVRSEQNNQLFSLDLASGEAQVLATAAPAGAGLGLGIALGGMSCLPGCSRWCLIADASRGKFLRFEENDGTLTERDSFAIGGAGLPPTSLTPYW